MKIFRVRRYNGTKGYSNYYCHADVITSTKQSALNAAKQNRVINWRHIDKFDVAESDYCYYEVLYRVLPNEAKRPKRPLNKEEKIERDKKFHEEVKRKLEKQAKLDAKRNKAAKDTQRKKERLQQELIVAEEEYKKAKKRLYNVKNDISIQSCECGTCKRCMGM